MFSPGCICVCGSPDAVLRCRSCTDQARRWRLLQAEGANGPHQAGPESQPDGLCEYKLELFPKELNTGKVLNWNTW